MTETKEGKVLTNENKNIDFLSNIIFSRGKLFSVLFFRKENVKKLSSSLSYLVIKNVFHPQTNCGV